MRGSGHTLPIACLPMNRRDTLAAMTVPPLAATAHAACPSKPEGERLNFVLVHGTWLGGWIWSEVVPLLFAAGHRAYAPTLTGVGERAHLISPEVGLETHIHDITGVIDAQELRNVVLVGHSFSGIAATGAADRRREAIRKIIFYDAIIPVPGRMAGVMRDPATGQLPPRFVEHARKFVDGYKMDFFADYPIQMLANDDEPEVQAMARRRITLHPMRGWTDELVLQHGGWNGLPRGLITCAGQKFSPSSDAMVGPAKADPAFDIVNLPVSRLGMLSHPALVANTLIAMGQRIA
jgi:pimeloyl-ACP methyl ester carboxylesterase